jgi:histidine ammonia-lyase
MLGWEGMRIRLMIRDHADRKAAGEIGKTEDNPLVDGDTKVAPTADAEAKRMMAFRELKAFIQHQPTLESVRDDRLKAMAALNLDSLPRYVLFTFPEVSSAYPGTVDP